jgi:antitoxin HicB
MSRKIPSVLCDRDKNLRLHELERTVEDRILHRSYRVLLEQDEDDKFTATVPELPGCISSGNTRDEALRNVKEAIEAYIESLQKHDEPVPPSINEEIVTVDSN